MKNITLYIISALALCAVLLVYINDLNSYGISLIHAIAFAAVIVLLIAVSGVIIRSLYKKIQNKDKEDSV